MGSLLYTFLTISLKQSSPPPPSLWLYLSPSLVIEKKNEKKVPSLSLLIDLHNSFHSLFLFLPCPSALPIKTPHLQYSMNAAS